MEHTRCYFKFGLVIQEAMSFKEKVYDEVRWTMHNG